MGGGSANQNSAIRNGRVLTVEIEKYNWSAIYLGIKSKLMIFEKIVQMHKLQQKRSNPTQISILQQRTQIPFKIDQAPTEKPFQSTN